MARERDSDPLYQGMQACLLPTRVQTRLLRACLLSGDQAAMAWQQWLSHTGSPSSAFEGEREGLRGLLPFIEYGLRRNGIKVEAAFLAYLRAARVREELRNNIYTKILSQILADCQQHAVRVIAVRGAVLAEMCYAEPGVRHNHAINLLVKDADIPAISDIVGQLKFRQASVVDESELYPRHVFEHETGLALELHTELFYSPYYHVPLERLQQRMVAQTIAGQPVQVLCATDNLLHVLGQAAYSRSRMNLRWVCDAWFLIRSAELDWELLVSEVQQSGLTMPVHTLLRYMHDELDAEVPTDCMNRLRQHDGDRHRLESEALAAAVVATVRSPLRALSEFATSRAERMQILRFLLLPSKTYLRWRYKKATSTRMVLFFYFYRPVKFIFRRLFARRGNSRRVLLDDA